MGLNTSLEEIERCGRRSIGRHILTGSILNNRHLTDERYNVTKELHQATDTHVATSADTEYGEDTAGYKTLTDTLTHLVPGLLSHAGIHVRPLEVLTGSGSLYQSGLPLLCLL